MRTTYLAAIKLVLYVLLVIFCPDEDCSTAVETVGKNIRILFCQCWCNKNEYTTYMSTYILYPTKNLDNLVQLETFMIESEQWKKTGEQEATVRTTYSAAMSSRTR